MLDHTHLLGFNGAAEVFYFQGTSATVGGDWQTWTKPRGKSMAHILVVGAGGNGGTGVIGAVSTAAGGGGGGSGGQTSIVVPLNLIPDTLFISLMSRNGSTTTPTQANAGNFVSIYPNTTANNCLVSAISGAAGGNGSGATAGAAGAAGIIATAAMMPLGWQFQALALVGQAGIIAGTTGAAGALTLPVTGLMVTGGTGGAGLGAIASAGTAGGAFTVAGVFPAHAGGTGGSSATTPPGNGSNGYKPINKSLYGYGGTGGGSTNGSATGAGLVQSSGGHGAPGCGGGGVGGALTGSAAGVIGFGGPAFCIITCW